MQAHQPCALQRADQIEYADGGVQRDWLAPIVADAEAGFGGPLNVFEIMKAYIEAGAAEVHFEDQLASEKKCGHLGGKVLIPTSAHERNLNAGRLAAADVCGVPTLIMRARMRKARNSLSPTLTSATESSSPANARQKASTTWSPAPDSRIASNEAWLLRATPICFGGKRRNPISNRRAISLALFIASFRVSFWLTTVRLPSTGPPT